MSSRKSLRRQTTVSSSFEHLDNLLDEALRQSFPASDAIAIDFRTSETALCAAKDDESRSAANGSR
jgi:hypothetical protein